MIVILYQNLKEWLFKTKVSIFFYFLFQLQRASLQQDEGTNGMCDASPFFTILFFNVITSNDVK